MRAKKLWNIYISPVYLQHNYYQLHRILIFWKYLVVYFSLKYVTKTIVKLIVDDFNEHDDFLMSDFRKYYAYFSIDILTKDIAIIAFRLMTCCADEMRSNNVTEPP